MTEGIKSIITHDVAGRPDPENGDRVYFEREIKSVETISKAERKFIALYKSLDKKEDPKEIEVTVRNMGRQLGFILTNQYRGGRDHGKFDISDKYRVGSYLQHFITRLSIQNLDTSIFRNSTFLESLKDRTCEFSEEIDDMDAILRGAENFAEYYDIQAQDTDIVFASLSVHLDTRHSIDMILGRTKEAGPFMDQIDLYEVKSSKPKPEEIEEIHKKHIDFVRGRKEIILNGFGLSRSPKDMRPENRKLLDHIDGTDNDEFIEIINDRIDFLEQFLIEASKKIVADKKNISTWSDIEKLANTMNINPVLLAIRIRNATDATTAHLKTIEKDYLKMMRNIIFNIQIPVEHLGIYHRLMAEDTPHIGEAFSWKSIIAYKSDGKWQESILDIEEV
jgi:hypothetical protein